jgi:hypothetical protein
MLRTYRIEGQQVTITWTPRHHPPVSGIRIAGTLAVVSLEKTAGGTFHARDDHRRPLGTFLRGRDAVERVVRAQQPGCSESSDGPRAGSGSGETDPGMDDISKPGQATRLPQRFPWF